MIILSALLELLRAKGYTGVEKLRAAVFATFRCDLAEK